MTNNNEGFYFVDEPGVNISIMLAAICSQVKTAVTRASSGIAVFGCELKKSPTSNITLSGMENFCNRVQFSFGVGSHKIIWSFVTTVRDIITNQ